MRYPSDLTTKQWNLIKHHFNAAKGAHLRKHSKRRLADAVLYLVKTGCQWRQLPHDFPPYKTVSSFYNRAKTNGLWEKIMDELVGRERVNAGRNAAPSYGLVDSQSVKTTLKSEGRGIDGGKKRKAAKGI
jgi:putative transposase